jgi:hypothetical protein
MNEWHLDIDSWPGPNRKKWPDLRDIIQESPGGKHVAVLYSCGEIDIYKEVGFFALFEEPKDSPCLLLRPSGLACLISSTAEKSIQWIGDRFCVVTPYSLSPSFSLSGQLKQFYGIMVFDVKERKVAYVPKGSPEEVIPALPDKLSWKSWRRLSWWPKLWHKNR